MYTIKGETDHQPRLDAWDKRSDLVLWEDLEGVGGEGGGRGIGMGKTCKNKKIKKKKTGERKNYEYSWEKNFLNSKTLITYTSV